MPMGLLISPDVFQHRMDAILGDLPFVIIYIDDAVIATSGSFEHHLQALDQVFTRLRRSNVQVNAKKSDFCSLQMEYLGFLLSAEGIRPDPRKVEAIMALKAPKNRKELRHLLGLVNYIRETIAHHSEYTSVLSDLTSPKKPYKWTPEHQEAFKAIQKEVSKATMLAYPDFEQPFEIHTDASH